MTLQQDGHQFRRIETDGRECGFRLRRERALLHDPLANDEQIRTFNRLSKHVNKPCLHASTQNVGRNSVMFSTMARRKVRHMFNDFFQWDLTEWIMDSIGFFFDVFIQSVHILDEKWNDLLLCLERHKGTRSFLIRFVLTYQCVDEKCCLLFTFSQRVNIR